MQTKTFRWISGLVILLIITSACSLFSLPVIGTASATATSRPAAVATATVLPAPQATAEPGSQPVQISGSFSYTNEFFLENLLVEHAVALADMHGFVVRDHEWVMPIESQTLGYAKIDTDKNQGSFWLQLPEQPAAVFEDVDNNGSTNTGVQIFCISYWPNIAGGPYSEGDDPSRGWPSYLTSMTVDSENQDEVTGGKLVVWSPDATEQFPTGFGADGLLFTKDDPVAPIPAGYSIIDLDKKPFAILRDREPQLTLYEPTDLAIKDYSGQSFTQAFDNLVNTLRKEYAFNGIPGKQPDWDAMVAKVAPEVKAAESKQDTYAFYEALVDFTHYFKDGHLGLNGGDNDGRYFVTHAAGGYGFAVREADDGSVIVTYVGKGTPAEKAGMQVGDRVTDYNDQPIRQAISQVKPLFPSNSSDFAIRYAQAVFLTRAAVGTPAKVTFSHQGGSPKTVSMTAVDERQSLLTAVYFQSTDPTALPVEYRILNTNQGYVKINSNSDDLNLMVRLFERALKTFKAEKIDSLIIDLRQNSGGSPQGLAGFLTDKTIELGQLEYYSAKTGKFEPEGPRDKFYPNETQYRFSKIAVLVAQTCYSACELEAYGFSQLPGAIVVGETPSAGVEAEVARGQFKLPGGMDLQAPTGRFVNSDGSLFLEGQGVQPTVKVPVTAASILSSDDVVLKAAEDALK